MSEFLELTPIRRHTATLVAIWLTVCIVEGGPIPEQTVRLREKLQSADVSVRRQAASELAELIASLPPGDEAMELVGMLPQQLNNLPVSEALLRNLEHFELAPDSPSKRMYINRALNVLSGCPNEKAFNLLKARVVRLRPFDFRGVEGWIEIANLPIDEYQMYCAALAGAAEGQQMKEYWQLLDSSNPLIKRNLIWAIGYTLRPEFLSQVPLRTLKEKDPVLAQEYCRVCNRIVLRWDREVEAEANVREAASAAKRILPAIRNQNIRNETLTALNWCNDGKVVTE